MAAVLSLAVTARCYATVTVTIPANGYTWLVAE